MTSPGVKMVTRAASRPPPPYSSPSPSLVFQLDAMAPILFGFFSVSSGLRSTFLLCIEKGKVTTVHNANLMSVTAGPAAVWYFSLKTEQMFQTWL